MISLYSKLGARYIKPVAPKWHPGIYAKIAQWQLKVQAQIDLLMDDLTSTPQLRGLKEVLAWGNIESRSGGVPTFDWSSLDDKYDLIKVMDNKHHIIAIPWREFDEPTEGVTRLLPNDLRTDSGIDIPTGLTKYDYAWHTTDGLGGVNLRLWDDVLFARLEYFIAKLAQRYDKLEFFTQIATLETSPLGTPAVAIPGMTTDNVLDAYQDGQLRLMRVIKKYFGHTPYIAGMNFPRTFVQELTSIIVPEKMGFGGPNSNLAFSLNRTDTFPGVLTYVDQFEGVLPIAFEIQGDEFRRSAGENTTPDDFPTPTALMQRCRDLHNNYTIITSTSPYWRAGANGNEPMIDHIKDDATINSAPDGAGSFANARPSSLI